MPARLLPVMTLMIFVVMVDGRVMTAMLPDIARDLDATVAATGIAVTTYLLAYGVFQLAYGPVSDRVGAIRVMSVAAIVFAAVLASAAAIPFCQACSAPGLLPCSSRALPSSFQAAE